jgi:cobalamin biosynthesis protein CobT
MQNPSTDGQHSAYFNAVSQADADLAEALGHIRAEEDTGRITPVEAAAERVELLERHLELCQQARLDHLGGTP